MPATLLLLDDDVRLAKMVTDYLAPHGFTCLHAETVAQAQTLLAQKQPHPFDGALLDVMLPDGDGFDFLRDLRRVSSSLPVLMLTARGDAMDRVVGLELGADDYLPKPFEPRELLARLRAVMRRAGPVTGQQARNKADVLCFGALEIDRGAHRVTRGGTECALTGHQFALLLALAENAGRVLSRDQLMRLTKGEELEAFDRSIDVHISRIRALIEDDPKQPRHLLTLRGVGYLFAAQRDD